MAAPVLGAAGKSTVVGLMLALFVAALDSTVVATAMPTVAAALGGEARYAWPMTAYLVASTVSTLLCGGLAFSFGLRRGCTWRGSRSSPHRPSCAPSRRR